MKINYLVTVKDELEEIKKLIPYLLSKKEDEDEIVVLQDYTSAGTADRINISKLQDTVQCYLITEVDRQNIKYVMDFLNEDFATFKNYGKSECSGDYIFQIDADEIPSAYFLENLKTILAMNENIELFWLPRINIVKGLTAEWVQRWGWRLSDIEEYKDLVNWPDYQSRLFKNVNNIKWVGDVHEVLTGAQSVTYFLAQIEYALYHEKELDKQIKQNEHYSKIISEK